MRVHPACRVFPLLEGEEFKAFVADIKKHGQREPIVLDAAGQILDGRNRERACRRLKLEPRTKVWHPHSGGFRDRWWYPEPSARISFSLWLDQDIFPVVVRNCSEVRSVLVRRSV